MYLLAQIVILRRTVVRLKSLFCMSLLCIQGLYATNENKAKYLEYLKHYPLTLGPDASYRNGEIEIIRDEKQMIEIQNQTNRTVGIVAEDNYWIWINDAVRFPNGTQGVYGRVIWRRSLEGIAGVAVMPLLPNGKIALNRNFRHATRSWEYELPRGGLSDSEAPEQAALREMKEETGLLASKIEFLGYMNPDSGMTNTVVPVYLAQVSERDSATPEDSEAIASVDAFTVAELKQGFLNGYLTTEISGESVRINLRDPFLSFALLQWEIRQR